MAGIGDIADIPHLIAEMKEIAVDKIKCNKRAGMTQMTFAADGRSADIHSHMAGCKRGKNFFLSCIRIVDF